VKIPDAPAQSECDWYLLQSLINVALSADRARGASSRPPDCPNFAGLSSSAEELIATVGLKPGNVDSVVHVEAFENFTSLRIDSPQVALFNFPGCVPQFSLDPSDSGDKTIGLDSAKDGACLGINLMVERAKSSASPVTCQKSAWRPARPSSHVYCNCLMRHSSASGCHFPANESLALCAALLMSNSVP